jgi:uncharacterized protein YdcH (DUF465 family)
MVAEIHRAQFSETPFTKLQELHDRLNDLIFEYEGDVPLAGVLGVLRILEHTILEKSRG